MANYCSDCGCKIYNGACTNCDEEVFIADQYRELDMELPAPDTDFSRKLEEGLQRQAKRLYHESNKHNS